MIGYTIVLLSRPIWQKWNGNQLSRTCFRALGAGHMYLLKFWLLDSVGWLFPTVILWFSFHNTIIIENHSIVVFYYCNFDSGLETKQLQLTMFKWKRLNLNMTRCAWKKKWITDHRSSSVEMIVLNFQRLHVYLKFVSCCRVAFGDFIWWVLH